MPVNAADPPVVRSPIEDLSRTRQDPERAFGAGGARRLLSSRCGTKPSEAPRRGLRPQRVRNLPLPLPSSPLAQPRGHTSTELSGETSRIG